MEMNLLNRMVLMLLFLVSCNFTAGFSSKKNLEVQKHLNTLNKTPLKSIKSPDGDIIDCIHISRQPAFDHPLLQNHTIQLRPKYYPEGLFEDKRIDSLNSGEGPAIKQLWHLNGACPEGTIPVRRTKKEDVLRASSIKNYGKKKHPNSAEPHLVNPKYEHAVGSVDHGKYFGAKGAMNVWAPKVEQPNEFSISQISVLGGSVDNAGDLTSIEAGWQVCPNLYGDNRTRLFTFWTKDAYKSTGCYNLLCSGFIQTNKEIALGGSIFPVSSYDGSLYDITILIWKDPHGGDWWMAYNNNQLIGYWPDILFTNLSDGATLIEWGGQVVNFASDGHHTTTQMGSGHFPGEGFHKASFFSNIQVVDGSNIRRDVNDIKTFADQPSCYDVQTGNNGQWGTYLLYGGPGRNPNCP